MTCSFVKCIRYSMYVGTHNMYIHVHCTFTLHVSFIHVFNSTWHWKFTSALSRSFRIFIFLLGLACLYCNRSIVIDVNVRKSHLIFTQLTVMQVHYVWTPVSPILLCFHSATKICVQHGQPNVHIQLYMYIP